ncbi:hypothetical protein HYPSUDRAFT_407955 [Hypholoma sublateritium FD-334 SS-4]|uniref:Uncharacterized protein n=1 Tax=Hypholoma sublateritium (strain FD-334 SS-4) TaxID=945553 RepID=A0A0D2Q207_HYPSF|nr:hypothetical protein HYPSUDRAFT_407955 [Hypholoma sublateritium FD-334 SS-4]
MSTLSLSEEPGSVYRGATIALIGTLANWILYGVLLVQICLYYAAFPNDHRLLKQTVLLALVLETIQTTMFTQHVFQRFTRGFNDLLLASEVGTVWFSVPLMTGLIALLTQVFYCYRIAILTKAKYAVAVIAMLSISQLGLAIATAIQTKEAALVPNVLGTKISLITIGIWGASKAGCDTTIAVIMV